MSGQRARPSVAADHRSAHPNVPGVPWWGAVVIAVVASVTGFALDVSSGDQELTGVFSALYVLGCVAAVLAVRQAAVFTAVIQPPLILFVMVPGSYYLMHSSDIHGIKDVLINCGYPLIERFPLMFFTSAAVLLMGGTRWYLGASSRGDDATDGVRLPGSGLAAKLAALLGRESASDSEREPRRRHSVDRRPQDARRAAADRAARPERGGRPAKRTSAPPRSRHARPPNADITQPAMDVDRPRPPRAGRPRPNEPMPPAEPRRRPRATSQRDPRRAVPPRERRAAYDRAERPERPPQRGRYDGYEPMEPHRSGNESHHPVSRVRYRGPDEADSQFEHRTRRRGHRSDAADRWEYDI